MDTKVAVLSIIIEQEKAVEQVNEILHEFGEYVIGRLGIPYRKKEINIICLAIDAPMDRINALSGALGRLDGVSAKAACAKV